MSIKILIITIGYETWVLSENKPAVYFLKYKENKK